MNRMRVALRYLEAPQAGLLRSGNTSLQPATSDNRPNVVTLNSLRVLVPRASFHVWPLAVNGCVFRRKGWLVAAEPRPSRTS